MATEFFIETKYNFGERSSGGMIGIYADKTMQTLLHLYPFPSPNELVDGKPVPELPNPLPIDNNGIATSPIFIKNLANYPDAWYACRDAHKAIIREGKVVNLSWQGDTGVTPDIEITAATGVPGSHVSINKSGSLENPKFALTIPRGDVGATPNIAVTTATGAAGTNASVVRSGSNENPTLAFTIPRGATPNISATATTGAAGTNASVVRSGTDENPTFAFTVPRGANGTNGADGTPGTTSVSLTNIIPTDELPIIGTHQVEGIIRRLVNLIAYLINWRKMIIPSEIFGVYSVPPTDAGTRMEYTYPHRRYRLECVSDDIFNTLYLTGNFKDSELMEMNLGYCITVEANSSGDNRSPIAVRYYSMTGFMRTKEYNGVQTYYVMLYLGVNAIAGDTVSARWTSVCGW